jgi:hypothetical protein
MDIHCGSFNPKSEIRNRRLTRFTLAGLSVVITIIGTLIVLLPAVQAGDSRPVFLATREAIDATTVVWRSQPVGQPTAAGGLTRAAERRHIEIVSDGGADRQMRLHWQRIELQLPPAADNLARKANGATFSASTVSGPLLLGEEDHGDALPLIKTRWRDATRAQYPDWVEVRFPQPREIDTVVLRTFGEHVRGRNKEGIRSYELRCALPDGSWLTVATVKDNMKEWLVHQFPAVTTQAVRLVVTQANAYAEMGGPNEVCRDGSSNGDFSRLQDFLVFRLGEKRPYRVGDVSRRVSVEKGSSGRVAIFKDDVPMPEGVPTPPDDLATLLRRSGYGVTFLDADLLVNSSILSKEHFDLFVQPYGCSFPLGTTLYQFLESGGHLLTLGGRAFTNALVRSKDGKLLASGYDPGIITSPGKMVRSDWFVPLREMLGIFAGPYQVFKHVARAWPAAGQFVVDPALRFEGAVEGYPSTGMMGQIISDAEEAQFAKEGKEWDHYTKIRPALWDAFRHGRTPRSPEYHIFNKTCSRWVPLLESCDRFDRPRGSLGAMMLNHDGRYRGSNWAFFGATNRDLFAADHPQAGKLLLGIVAAELRATYLHGLTPGYYCYRQGEAVTARVFAANFGPADRTGRVTFSFLPEHGDVPVFSEQREIRIPKGRSTPIDVRWAPGAFALDFYRIRCVLDLDGAPADQIETGIVVWDEKTIQGKDAFHVDYHDNYFHDGGRPLFINGARTDGLQRIGQLGEDPLAWEQEYRMMQENGINVASPIWFDVYLPGTAWGEELPELVPEKILRQMDAQVQLCQRHKVIYAPCLFFANREVAASTKRDLSRRICKLLGQRYCKVPGIVFYIWDDGAFFSDGDRANFNAFAAECATAFSANSENRKYVVMAELKDSERIGTRRMCSRLTVANHWGSNPWDIVSARMADQRAAGKSLSTGEFYWWADRGEQSGHRYYLAFPHAFFGLGYSWVLNWKWKDNDHALFSWGVVQPCDAIPRDCLYTWRNESWFLRSMRPKYVQPELMFVLPEFYWDKSEHLKDAAANCREVDNSLFAEMGKVIQLGHIDMGVIDDWSLDKLAPHTKALVYPAAFCPDDATYKRLCDFVRSGGHLYLTGDISYEPQQQRRRPERLAELAGLVPAEPLSETKVPPSLAAMGRAERIKPVQAVSGWKEPYAGRVALRLAAKDADVIATDAAGAPVVARHKLGKGSVLFNADVSAAAPPAILRSFLEQAGVQRPRTEPDDPSHIRVFRLPTQNGQVFGLALQGGSKTAASYDGYLWLETAGPKREYTITTAPTPVSLTLGRSPMVMAGFDGHGKLVACETDGPVKLDGKTIVDTTSSVMVFTLDGRPIAESEAVVALPQPFAKAEVQIAVSPTLDHFELGDVQDGAWQVRHQAPLARGAAGAKFSLDRDESLCVVLLCHRADRGGQVQKLRAFLQGHFDD